MLARARQATRRYRIELTPTHLLLRVKIGDPSATLRRVRVVTQLCVVVLALAALHEPLSFGLWVLAGVDVVLGFCLVLGPAHAAQVSARRGPLHRMVRRSIEVVFAETGDGYRGTARPARFRIDGRDVDLTSVRETAATGRDYGWSSAPTECDLRGAFLVFDRHVVCIEDPWKLDDARALAELMARALDVPGPRSAAKGRIDVDPRLAEGEPFRAPLRVMLVSVVAAVTILVGLNIKTYGPFLSLLAVALDALYFDVWLAGKMRSRLIGLALLRLGV